MEEWEDALKEEDEEDVGDGGGLSPFPLPPFPLPPPEDPSYFGGLELSPCNLLFLSV